MDQRSGQLDIKIETKTGGAPPQLTWDQHSLGPIFTPWKRWNISMWTSITLIIVSHNVLAKVLVTRIIMEGDKAVGVELKQGKKVELMRKAIVLNLMLMIGPKILILYTTWRHWVTLMATLQSMNSNRLQRSKKDVFILSLSSPFDLKYVELWHARVLLLYNTNHLTIFYAEVGKKFSRSQWS